jgi:hypothetical protein
MTNSTISHPDLFQARTIPKTAMGQNENFGSFARYLRSKTIGAIAGRGGLVEWIAARHFP